MTYVKALPAKVKAAAETEPAGTFEAIVAAYNTDSCGDRIVPGAFQKSLDAWAQSGNQMPTVWAHQHNDAFAYIGGFIEAAETSDGLVVKGKLDIEDNPTAAQVYKLIKAGRISNYSFAYDVLDSEQAKSDDDTGATTLLKELELFEAGPCLVGMNRQTRTLGVKSAIPVSAGPKSTADGTWDGPAAKKNLKSDGDAAYYRSAFAWVDPDKDATTLAAYSFIHHEVAADGTVGAANIQACTTGIGVLNGGRGGSNVPDGDKQGVYNHLAAHIKASGGDPPELKAAVVATKDGDSDHTAGQIAQAVDAALDAATLLLDGVDVAALPAEVQQALALVTDAAVSADALLDALNLPDPDGDSKTGGVQTKDLPGSFEERQNAVIAALTGADPMSDSWAWPVATFADTVVYQVTGGTGGTFQAPYSIGADGVATIGEPTPVQITETLTSAPKAGAVRVKEGRVLSAANLAALKTGLQSIQNGVEKIEAVTGVADDDDAKGSGSAQTGEPAKTDDDQTAKAEADEPGGKSGDAHAHVPAGEVSDPPEIELLKLDLDLLTTGS